MVIINASYCGEYCKKGVFRSEAFIGDFVILVIAFFAYTLKLMVAKQTLFVSQAAFFEQENKFLDLNRSLA